MTDTELFGVFGGEYGPDGYPVIKLDQPPPPSEREMFEEYCRSCCVRDPDTIEELWQEHQAKRREAAERLKEKRRGRAGGQQRQPRIARGDRRA